uniref:Uncharacterized protein n=1 Tax=Solanum lycopersicum TaxID=4081 RepID=A0A3Q7HC02_SOLLC
MTGTDSSLITSLQNHLEYSFHIKYLCTLTYIFVLEVNNVVSVDLISFASLQDSSSLDTPLELNVKCCCEEVDLLLDSTIFRQIFGSLNYITITRPDISLAV